MKVILSIAFLIGSGATVFGACDIKGTTAIYCPTGTLAMVMFSTYGYDTDLMHRPNNIALIHNVGCGFVARGVRIRQIGHGRIPLVDGWFGITTVALGEHDDGYMADDYLTGKCALYKPLILPDPSLTTSGQGGK